MAHLKVSPQRTIKLQTIKVGDRVRRLLAGTVRMELIVGEVTETTIKCMSADGAINLENGWTFSRQTGAEIDEELGWDGFTHTGSFLEV